MKKLLFLSLLFVFVNNIFAQNVGIGTITPDAGALLDITATNKGILIPRVTLTGINDISTIPGVTRSLLVYNTATAGSGNLAVQPGYYYWSGTFWVRMLADDGSAKSAWLTGGNNGTLSTTNFIGTPDAQALQFKINNTNAGYLGLAGNTYWGLNSGNVNSTGFSNVAVGSGSLLQTTNRSNLVAVGDSALLNNGTGAATAADATNNTAIGSKAMLANTKGNDNTAIGFQTLKANTTGIYNTAVGSKALITNTTGNGNIALGTFSLFSNTTGSNNIANGYQALSSNITGISNVGIGKAALLYNANGSNIVAIGDSALLNYDNNSTSYTSLYGNNTAVGSKALYTATTGTSNTAVGSQTLYANTIGNFNVAVGNISLHDNTTGDGNTAVGMRSMAHNVSGYNNVAVGRGALLGNNSSGYSNVAIGETAMYSNTTGYGNSSLGISSLSGNTTGFENVAIGALAMLQNTSGSRNSSLGSKSLFLNSTGSKNVAIGASAMQHNKTGFENVAVGNDAMTSNTTGNNNVAIGFRSLYLDSSGTANTAVGNLSQFSNETGSNNTANGSQALYNNLSGDGNTAIGRNALSNITRGDFNTALGEAALSGAAIVNKNTAIGYKADAPGILSTNATAIGANAIANCDNCMVLGSVPGLNGGTANINVGIGANAPQTDLHINPNGAGSLLIGTNKNTGGYTNLEMGINTQSGGYGFIQATKASGSTYGDLILNQSGGNVGIGVTAPQTDLHINPHGAGSILVGTNRTSGGYTNLEMGISSQSNGYSYIQSTKASGSANGTLQLNPSGGFVTTGSYVGIGTNTPFFPLDVVQSNNPDDMAIRILSPGHNWGMGISPNSHELIFNHNFIYRASISPIDGSYTSYSDKRMKKNIEDLSPVLNKVLQLKAKKYQGIDAEETTKKSTGFISQEVVDLFPELVNTFKRSAEDPKLYLGLNYAGFSVIAIKAIQEQQVMIDALKIQVEAAKAEIPMQIGKQQQQIQSQQQIIDTQNKKLEDFQKRLQALEAKK